MNSLQSRRILLCDWLSTDRELGRVTHQVSALGAIDKSLQDYHSNKIFPRITFNYFTRQKCDIFLKYCDFQRFRKKTRVPAESWILEKVLKFAQQFSIAGKSLENRDEVWKNGKFLSYN